jgi:hypothetical protein
MTEPTRCDWSDLPTTDCDHCHPGERPRQPRTGATAHAEILAEAAADLAQILTRSRMRVVHPVAHQAPTVIVGARQLVDTPVDLVDYVTALCDPTHHAEAYLTPLRNADGTTTFVTQRHRTTSPPLLEQLWATVEASGSAEGGQRSFASKPSARLDAIDAANDVEHQVFGWLTRLGHRPDGMDDTIAAVRHLGALAAGTDRDTHELIESDVRSWWIRARVLTGWDSPAWRPNNTCPLCAVKGGLRIRLDHHSGTCVECRATWSPDNIGLLADHIRVENDEDGQRAAAEAESARETAAG